jgi:hypothetical protein
MSTKPVRSEEKKRHAAAPVDFKSNLRNVNPALLKDRLYQTLIGMTESDRSAFTRRLITALTAAGVNVSNHMLLLGCNVNQVFDATANDVALLIRYYRINQPHLLDILVTVLDQFPAVSQSLGDLQSQGKAA